MSTVAEAIAKAPVDLQPVLAELAEALRTDRIVEHFDTRMDRVEAAIERLTEAQAHTDKAVQDLARQVGGLSDKVGFTIEEMGRIRVHDYLERPSHLRSEALPTS